MKPTRTETAPSLDFESMLYEALDSDYEECERLAESVMMTERIASGEFDFKEKDRVCLKNKPWQRGTIGAAGRGRYHVHWDDLHPDEVDANDIKRTDR